MGATRDGRGGDATGGAAATLPVPPLNLLILFLTLRRRSSRKPIAG